MMMKKILLFLLFIFISGCSVYQTFVNLSRLQFKLGPVNNFELNGITLSDKNKLTDFKLQDILNISSMFTSGEFPVSFVLNVEAKNPNDGTGGYKATDATIKALPWRLLIDDKETVSGNIGQPVSVPGTGEITTIPIVIQMDLLQFFKDKGYESLINLALTLGGKNGSSSKLTLYADPVVSSVLGDISYPGELKIVDHSFTNK
jgi:hypothetical protein